ncbi:hypothetical protein [Kribbella catacumbae]|uniref:hypothetical protein n=1 Tax=Kribbella catacumbae TaxID=460086 RepID=UPI0012FB84BA|nr:hypothetical protein [Kribbella catacumbae]
MNYIKSYSTFAALRADSSAIVKVTAGERKTSEVDGLPVTVTTATVNKVVWGELAGGPVIELRQVGNTDTVGVNTSRLLESGGEYLVFVVPSTGATDASPNRYLIAGEAGVYQLQADQYVFRGGNVPPGGSRPLPATLQGAGAEAIVIS